MLFSRTGSPPGSTLFPYTTLFRSDAGGIFVTSGENLVVGTLDTANATSQNIAIATRAEAHTSELQSHRDFVCGPVAEKLTPSGAFTLSENLNLGSLSVSGGTAMTL